MIIRLMENADVPQVVAIEGRVSKNPWTEQGFYDSLAGDQAHFIVAEDEEGQILGFCGYYLTLDEAEIVEVGVDSDRQNGGIGYALVTRLMQDAREAGAYMIILEVRLSNASAIHVYEKAGLGQIGVRKRFYSNPEEDAVIMQWIRQDN